MDFFRRTEITLRCACRGTTLAMPDRDGLLDACEPGLRRRLQARLAKQADDGPSWSVQWRKAAGDTLRPKEIVATLRRDQVTVELVCAQKGLLADVLAPPGARVATGSPLARIERRAKTAAATEPPSTAVLRQFVSRQRQDAALIASLQTELAALRAQQASAGAATTDLKFRRLKHEFSKHYHPEAHPPGDTERNRRERVFREFWPVVEAIERS